MICAELPLIPSFEDWRDKARVLLAQSIQPETIVWQNGEALDLFGRLEAGGPLEFQAVKDRRHLAGNATSADISVPRAFIDLARKAVLHSDPERFALLYRLLWRVHADKSILEDASDPDVVRLEAMAKGVRRDEHKMHAFVRFKEIETEAGVRFIAWFEPQHHILHESAEFFVRRFAGMAWSIITPEASAHWDVETLSFGPGGARDDVPEQDAHDGDWLTYYESMFNPTRLNPCAMRREMPKHYWRNLPEARVIPELVESAQARAETMVAAEPTSPRKRAGAAHARIAPEALSKDAEEVVKRDAAPADLKTLREAVQACRACPLWRDTTQAVPGEGAVKHPLIAFVGEQPGDQEDLAGHPFVGPAGKVLDRALAEAGIERGETFVTNAVKHFKHEPRGKRRLHKRPDRAEVEVCRWWLENELKLVKPKLIVALGATALQSLSTHRGSLESARGRDLETREGAKLRATVHPSYLLRLPDEEAKEQEYKRFVADLQAAKRAVA